jgi:hypothetical protein
MRVNIWTCSSVAAVLPLVAALAADAPKARDKGKPRVVITDPAEAGPDFAVQGEYAGNGPEGKKLGAQIVADGGSEFSGRLLEGGLPGDGWDGQKQIPLKGKTEGDATVLRGKTAGDEEMVVTISGGKLTAKSGGKTATLDRVERRSPTEGAKPPAGATVLFDGTSPDAWNGGKLIENKYLNVGVKSKAKFKDFTLHLEFRLPFMPYSRGQGRGNSGVYLQDRYECQVLDSFALKGLNNECGGFYQAFDPKVNMCYPPLAWQTYDIDFTAAKYEGGKKVANARATVKHNGVVVQDNVEFVKGSSPGGQKEEDAPGPLQLQNHNDPVVYRNIWVVEKK